MTIIDGKTVARKVLDECQAALVKLAEKGIRPGLAVVLVGDDPASRAYVGSKDRTCRELGLHSEKI